MTLSYVLRDICVDIDIKSSVKLYFRDETIYIIT